MCRRVQDKPKRKEKVVLKRRKEGGKETEMN
jgi:hypothetical protein